MSQGLQVVKSLPVLPAHIVSTNIPPDPHAAWASGTTYADKARVVYNNRVYESITGVDNKGKQPDIEIAFWVEVGPTNLWKAFDLSSTTRMRFDTAAFIEMRMSQGISDLLLLALEGVTRVHAKMDDPGFGNVYDETFEVMSVPTESGWYAWTFELRVVRDELLISGLPSYPNSTLRLEMEGIVNAGVGVIAVGQLRQVGKRVEYGAKLGIQDFSRKDRNEYGDFYLKQGAFAKTANFTVGVPNDDVDNVFSLLASLRAVPCLWIGTDQWRATTVWGVYQSFDIDIAYYDESILNISLEGLI